MEYPVTIGLTIHLELIERDKHANLQQSEMPSSENKSVKQEVLYFNNLKL